MDPTTSEFIGPPITSEGTCIHAPGQSWHCLGKGPMLVVSIWHVWQTKAPATPGRSSLPRPCGNLPKRAVVSPMSRTNALIREEAVPVLQARLLRLEIPGH